MTHSVGEVGLLPCDMVALLNSSLACASSRREHQRHFGSGASPPTVGPCTREGPFFSVVSRVIELSRV